MPKFKFNKNALGGIITEDKVTEDTETVGKKLILQNTGNPYFSRFQLPQFSNSSIFLTPQK